MVSTLEWEHGTAAAQVAAWWRMPWKRGKLIGHSTRFKKARCGDRRAARWPSGELLMSDAEQEGIQAATRDIAAGVLRYKWLGSGGRGGKEFCQFVKERLGMIVDDFGVCFVGQEKRDFARGYNTTVRDHIITAQGRDIIEESRAGWSCRPPGCPAA